MVHYFRLFGDYVGTKFVLRYPLLVELIFIYFQPVLEGLQKAKVLFGQDELFDSGGEELLLRSKEHQLVG